LNKAVDRTLSRSSLKLVSRDGTGALFKPWTSFV